MKWKYDPKPAAAAQGVACCDQVNRSAAYANGKVFYNTLDGYTVLCHTIRGTPAGGKTAPDSFSPRI